ncbi:GPA5, alpha subunit of a heterotrimeric G protein [Ectocarpus siliculosus]|uniref:GPA5, alpha subunit of a heterotrimeric G protein n=1 Tax=Ectocarpus siliculosus TaxID=2880 RepID=D8LTN0_ECTSI|nr:GPA5, alpha subunit of a heterotrimeric G protein [Ectocarpus siliculosus]|eukprot:CBN73927.1 GPA5, alpha subunit of a heterotrimeric G protein [Ectocarpus siliculosus]
MGCVNSIRIMDADAATNEVDKQLEELALADQRHVKVLLLGAGESGKSTVVKQVKMIYKGGVSKKEKDDYARAIRRNVIESMQTLIDTLGTLGLALKGDDQEGLKAAKENIALLTPEDTLTPEIAEDVSKLWADEGMQELWSRRSEFWALDATPYYLQEARRLADPELEVTDEDMIMTRTRTTGIIVTEFSDNPYTYSLVDVGGQRSERRKWMHCFDDVKAIVFLVGLSGYHQVLFEDNSVNRMQESLELFTEVAGNPIFEKTPIFVFLNKKDLFEEMIVTKSLKKCFPEYDGPDGEAMPALRFIEQKYKQAMLSKVPGKDVTVHIIAARVRMDMKIAFGEVKDEIRRSFDSKSAGRKKSFSKLGSPRAAIERLQKIGSPLNSR